MLIRFLVVSASVFLVSSFAHANDDLIIRSATVIDGLGTSPQSNLDIEIIGGRIARMGVHLSSKVAKVLDAKGLYVMPGLIDCHTHLRSVPGAIFRNDSTQQIKEQQEHNLKSYVAAGVTTVLDAAAPESLFAEVNKRPESQASPRILGLAPFLTPQGGYFGREEARGEQYKDLWAPIKDAAEVAKSFERASGVNSLGAKVTIEKGFGPFNTWPVFDERIRQTIIEQAKKYKLPLFVHSMSEEEHRLALTMNPYALVHAGFYEKLPSHEILREIKESKAFVVTTLAIYKMTLLMWDQGILSDPWFQMLVPKNQLETAQNPDAKKWVIEQVVTQSRPSWCPEFLAKAFSSLFFSESLTRGQLAQSSKAVKLLHDEGIPLVMGSDAGNWPVWTTFFHGVGSILEMEALEEAGLPRVEIIIGATSRAAKMLKLDRQVGAVQVGMLADLLVLEKNPLENMKALRSIQWVIQNGNAKAPKDWLN